jgi:signal peptidase II
MRALRAAIVLTVFAADRATKVWAMSVLSRQGPIRVLPFLDLSYAENTGASFGLGTGANWLFTLISAALIAVLARQLSRWPKDNVWLQAGGALVLAGALGNFYDRLTYHFVVDFLDVHRFAVCNVADWCISAGAVMLFWGLRDVRTARAS